MVRLNQDKILSVNIRPPKKYGLLSTIIAVWAKLPKGTDDSTSKNEWPNIKLKSNKKKNNYSNKP